MPLGCPQVLPSSWVLQRPSLPLESWRWQGIICQGNKVVLCATPSLAPNTDHGMQVPPSTHSYLRAERLAEGPQQGQVELGVNPAARCQHPWCGVVGRTLWADVCRSGATAGSPCLCVPRATCRPSWPRCKQEAGGGAGCGDTFSSSRFF